MIIQNHTTADAVKAISKKVSQKTAEATGDSIGNKTADKITKISKNNDKEVVFKNYTPFTDCIIETNNTQIDNAKDMDVVMLMYNWIEYSNNYLELLGSLRQYYRDEPFLDTNGLLLIFLMLIITVLCLNLNQN